jgi:hypothetical protein
MTSKAHNTTKEHLNRRFNRVESTAGHFYLGNFGAKGMGNQLYSGLIKCKLAHGEGRSIIVPDLLFLGKDGTKWIQPLSFGPPLLTKYSEHSVECRISVDVSCAQRLEVTFKAEGFVQAFEDGSELYRCTFRGPRALQAHATGDSKLVRGRAPQITLYHHTTEMSKANILESGAFRLSPWNIQGTERQVKNAGYVYFTALDQIAYEEDLKCIAMSADEIIYMNVDGFNQPPPFSQPGELGKFPNQVLPLRVYRGSTIDRTGTLEFDIDASILAPQHLLLHTGDLPMWYEICNPFTQRVGAEPGTTVPFPRGKIERGSFPSKTFQYIVVGDASFVEGLAAPYNEEATESIFKIEPPQPGRPVLQLWFDAANTDLHSTKDPELQEFQQVT